MSKSIEDIKKAIKLELEEALQSVNAEDSVREIVEINEEDMTVTVKFDYNIVEEDDYIGLSIY